MITDFLESVVWGDQRRDKGFTSFFGELIPELCWGGVSLLEMQEPEQIVAFTRVQTSTLWKFYRDESGRMTEIWQLPNVNSHPLDPNRFVPFTWRTTDRNPFGFGLLHPMTTPKQDLQGNVYPALYQIKWQIENDIRRIIHRYGFPRSVFSFPGLGEDQLKDINEQVKDPAVDASITTNVAATVSQDTVGRAVPMEPYLDFMDARFQIGTGTTHGKLVTSTGYTEASAREARDESEDLIWDLQQSIKATMDTEVLERLLLQNGYSPRIIKAKFFWGSAEEEIDAKDVFTAVQSGTITPEAAQAILRDQLGWKIPKVQAPPEPPTPKQRRPPSPNGVIEP